MTGQIIFHTSPTPPTGYLAANGGRVPAVNYPNLDALPWIQKDGSDILLPDFTDDKPNDATGKYTLFAYIEY